MSRPIASYRTTFRTDFGIFAGRQEGVAPESGGTFVNTAPGRVSGHTVSRYATVLAVAERWDGRPPYDPSWEDIDELVFRPEDGAGLFRISGFDGPEEPDGLDLTGLGLGRVRVSAMGRHDHGSDGIEDASQMWLLQFWSDPDADDPSTYPPRRLLVPGQIEHGKSTGVQAAVRCWTELGWNTVLMSSASFARTRQAFGMPRERMSRGALAEFIAMSGVDDDGTIGHLERPINGYTRPDPLEQYSGRRVETIGDAIDAMIDLGLLLEVGRGDDRPLVPNVAPGAAYDLPGVGDDVRRADERMRRRQTYKNLGADLSGALWTLADGITMTIRAMSVRWSVRADLVREALHFLVDEGRVAIDPPGSIDDERLDIPIHLTRPAGP